MHGGFDRIGPKYFGGLARPDDTRRAAWRSPAPGRTGRLDVRQRRSHRVHRTRSAWLDGPSTVLPAKDTDTVRAGPLAHGGVDRWHGTLGDTCLSPHVVVTLTGDRA